MLTTKVRIGSCLILEAWGSNPRLPTNQVNMKNNTSYKEMLRNRIPIELDLTLKWCKCKTQWVNYVYSEFVQIFSDKKERDKTIRYILKKKIMPDPYGTYKDKFDFHGCINWDWLDKNDEEYWRTVEEWFNWFDHYVPLLQTSDDILVLLNSEDIEQKEELQKFLIKNICKS